MRGSHIGRIALASMLAAGPLVARVVAQPPAPAAQTPARTPAEEKALQQEVQRRADEIVTARLAEREAARRLGDEELERKKLVEIQEAAAKVRAEAEEVRPLDVEVVISRYQGDKKVSSLPYELVVNATRQTKQPVTVLRMGGRVPVPVTTFAAVADAGKEAPRPLTSWQYEDVSTQIDCSAMILRDGRFDLTLSIEDTGMASTTQDGADGSRLPIQRSFRTKNSIALRDGQTRQFTVAADRLTGETVRVDVTLRVAK